MKNYNSILTNCKSIAFRQGGRIRPDQIASCIAWPSQYNYFNSTHQRLYVKLMDTLKELGLVVRSKSN